MIWFLLKFEFKWSSRIFKPKEKGENGVSDFPSSVVLIDLRKYRVPVSVFHSKQSRILNMEVLNQ